MSKTDRFDTLVKSVLEDEGGYTNDPDDSGGPTNWGITLDFYQEHVGESANKERIQNLSRREAKEIYRAYVWTPANFALDDMSYDVLPVGIDRLVFSFAVNMGWKQAHTHLQKAIATVRGDVTIDGWLGPETKELALEADSRRLIAEVGVEATHFYSKLCLNDSSQSKFLEGWLRRALTEVTKATLEHDG